MSVAVKMVHNFRQVIEVYLLFIRAYVINFFYFLLHFNTFLLLLLYLFIYSFITLILLIEFNCQ